MPQLTWLITGCSSGFGEEFVKSLLKRGDRVIATARNNAEARLANLSKLGAAVLDLDVTLSQDLLDKRVEEAIQVYGVIDVLINCAGYVEAGMVEQTRYKRFPF
jgi:NAD(P)-dependent dehydrogenase (short-subunit alcohol dehydrogenase family)